MDLISSLRLSLVTCQRSRLGPAWQATEAVDADARLYLPLAGAAWLRFAGERLDLRRGRMFLIPPLARRSHGCLRFLDIAWLHCRGQLTGGVDFFQLWPLRVSVPVEDPEMLAARFAELARFAAQPGHAAALAADGLLRGLLAPFLGEPTATDLSARRRLLPALELAEHHPERVLSSTVLAAACQLSSGRFCRLFHAAFGLPPARYLRRRRVEAAGRLLADPTLTLDVIADRLGFSDAFHLSRCFKAVTGQSPQTWRRRLEQPTP